MFSGFVYGVVGVMEEKLSSCRFSHPCPVSLRHSSETFLHPEPQTYFFASFRVLEDEGLPRGPNPEGPTYTTIMESGPQNQNRDGFLGA